LLVEKVRDPVVGDVQSLRNVVQGELGFDVGFFGFDVGNDALVVG
jgi:hypothetical protein